MVDSSEEHPSTAIVMSKSTEASDIIYQEWQISGFETPIAKDILIAFLDQVETFGIKGDETYLSVYTSTEPAIAFQIEGLCTKLGLVLTQSQLIGKNWDDIWEHNFHPVDVGSICRIRASFHEPNEQAKYDVLIEPKMTFGTGHHPTTRMMIELMALENFGEKVVLDFGCGTGILSILSSQMGATHIEAIDIDTMAFENTTENAKLNAVTNIRPMTGSLESATAIKFDLILANISRNVILEYFPSMVKMLSGKGTIIISGFLREDIDIIASAVTQNSMSLADQLSENNWVAMKLKTSVL